ncbi:hypothetical protein GIB67_008756 [Kingdonia uniflora]|uniref:Uncharacterized protein n=1 Tax=Kingdonia uniflora TaxID=39325 RepID=A0A7J7P5K1_9MAGN|nr:hypothetical protein GIB67_008756 [Kingdonia uniflora]
MSTLVVEIFDRHLGDMKFQFGWTIIQMKPIHVGLILGICVSPIVNEFLFVDPEYIRNFRMRRFLKKKNTYGLKEIDGALKQAKLERHHDDVLRLNLLKIILSFLLPNKGRNVERNHIEVPAIGAAPAVGTPAIGSSSSTIEIEAVVVRECSQLEEHDTLLLGQYQFSTPEKIMKYKRKEEGNEKEDGKRKTAKLKTWQRDLQQKIQKIEEKKKSKGKRQKKTNANKKKKNAEEVDMPLKKKGKGTKMESLTDEQFDHQAAPGEGLKVVKDLMVDDDVEVGMEVNLEAISFEYGGGLLELKKGDKKDDEDEKDNDDEKDVDEKVKSVEEE